MGSGVQKHERVMPQVVMRARKPIVKRIAVVPAISGVQKHERVMLRIVMRARKPSAKRILVAMAISGVAYYKRVCPPVIRPVTKPSVKVLPDKNVFPLPNVIPPLVPPLVPLSPTRVASPVVGTSERVSECVAREGDTTVQQNRTEKRRGCFGRSNNYYRIFLSSIPCELRTRLVSLSNPKIYIYAIFSNYHVVSIK